MKCLGKFIYFYNKSLSYHHSTMIFRGRFNIFDAAKLSYSIQSPAVLLSHTSFLDTIFTKLRGKTLSSLYVCYLKWASAKNSHGLFHVVISLYTQ